MSATSANPSARARLHPRVSERRRRVAREAGQRRLGVLAILGVLGALAVTVLVLLHSSVLGVRHLSVVGATHTPASAIAAASGITAATPMIDVSGADLAPVRRLPWIATARLERHFPDAVTIVVTERHALAAEHLAGGKVALVDPSGRVLEILSKTQQIPSGLVPITLDAAAVRPGETMPGLSPELVAAADALPLRLLSQVETITTKAQLGLVVVLADGATARLGTSAELPAKYLALNTLLVHGAVAAGDVVDLRVPADPVLIR